MYEVIFAKVLSPTYIFVVYYKTCGMPNFQFFTYQYQSNRLLFGIMCDKIE